MLVLTIDHVPGHRIHAILGEVIGATVRPDDPYSEGVKSLDGVTNSDGGRAHAVIATRQEAVASLMERASQLGANVVVGMRFDHRSIGGRYVEVCAYGTAMVVSRHRSPLRRGQVDGAAATPARSGARA